ncbi:hypothetical protein D9M71_136250 [compost metagenome]
MNGLSDVRLKLYGEELQQAQQARLNGTVAGMSRWRLFWHRLETRRALLNLDDQQLRDIGLSPEQAREEGLKPFWR